MPAIDSRNPRRKRKPTAPPRQADQGDAARGRTPQRRPSTVATRPLGQKPFTAQRQQAREQTQTATRALPKPVIAAPPVIENPTPHQIRAAKAQIVASVQRQIGDTRGAERVARTQAIYDQIKTDPQMARVRRSITHWQREDEKLNLRAPRTATAKPGPPHRKAGIAGFATVDLTAASQVGKDVAEQALPGLLQVKDRPAEFVGNALQDIGTIGTAPFVAGASLVSLGKDIVTGHPGQAAEKVGQFGEDVAKGLVRDWSHPGKYLFEHPLLFGLDVTGAGAVVGRTAGAVGRFRHLERASTVRPPIALGEDVAAGVHERRGSRDLIRREIQRASDATRAPLRDPDGNVVMVEQAGRQVPVLRPRTPLEAARLNKRRADQVAARANSAERQARADEGQQRRVRGIRGRDARAIVAMAARGVITSADHMQADLTNYVARVRGQLKQHEKEVASGQTPTIYHHEGEVEAAKRNADLAERVLKSPRAMSQAELIVGEAIRHGGALVKRDKEAADAGLFEGGHEQARRARLVETAVEHLGGQHGTDPRLDARIAAMKRNERSLQARLNFGHVTAKARGAIVAAIQSSRETRAQLAVTNTERLRDRHGNPLEPEQIEAFLRSRGRDPDTVAYLPPNVSPRQFHKQFRPETRGTLDTPGHVRTGAQARKGAVENTAAILIAAGVRHATTITKAKHIDRLVGDHGMMHPAAAKAAAGKPLTKHEQKVVNKGGYFTGLEAAEAIRRAAARGERLVAVRAFPGRLDAQTQKIIREDMQGPGAMDGLGERLLNSRFLTDGELKSGRTPNVVLMQADLVKRLQDHLKPSTQAGKFGQLVNRAFRYAVLPQPRWLVGNFFEPLIVRMPGVGSGINVFGLGVDVAAGVRMIRSMERSADPKVRAAAEEIRAQQFGGLLFGNRGLTNRRTLEDFPALDATVQKAYAKMVGKLPVTRQMAEITGTLLKGGGKAIIAPLDLIFTLNRLGESGLQRAAFGKSVRREAEEFTRSWWRTLHLSQKALDDVGKGLTNTPAQQRLLGAQHELLGKYEGFSPTMRGVIQSVAPFLPWMLNAARFIYWTMPAHRSAQTALLVRINDVVAKDWEEVHQGVPPGMGLAIPNGKGGWVDVARYTPYGLGGQLREGQFRGVTSQLLPQISGPAAAIGEGEDPFGRPLAMSDRQKASGGDKVKVAINSQLEALTPYLSNARRLQERGETAFADSTVFSPKSKPGTSHGMSAARRVLDPFRPTYLRAPGNVEVPTETPTQAPQQLSRREQMLERRAARLEARSASSARREAMLERRAKRLQQR